MKFEAKVYVSLKESVLDPQGKTVMGSIEKLGYSDIKDVRIGKYIEVKVEADSFEKATEEVEQVSKNILVNPIVEKFDYEIMEVK